MVVIVLLGLGAFVFTWMDIESTLIAKGGSLDDMIPVLLLDLLMGVVAIAVYPLRRRKPLLVVGCIVALSAVSSLAAPAALFGMISLATRRRRGEIMVIATLFLASVILNVTIFPFDDFLPWWGLLLFASVLGAVPIFIGLYIGGRRQLLEVLQDRAQQAEREYASDIDGARMAERTRIAREMHDALAHRLSLVSLHAGVLEYRSDLSPGDVRATASVVRENAHLAARDLRDVLGVLRESDGTDTTDTTRPPPSMLDALGLLVQDSRRAGSPTVLTIGDSVASVMETLPAPTRLHVQRVVQEALTNARKHAPGKPTEVHLGGAAGDRLWVTVTNPLPGSHPGSMQSGFGLTGLRERARIAGGELVAGQRGGSFVLQAWFPWQT